MPYARMFYTGIINWVSFIQEFCRFLVFIPSDLVDLWPDFFGSERKSFNEFAVRGFESLNQF